MTVYIDPPTWPGHGRMWSHLVSDASFAELHAFAARLGTPRRAFGGTSQASQAWGSDHYDVPAERYAEALRLGAVAVGSRDIVRLLRASGLRRPKRRP